MFIPEVRVVYVQFGEEHFRDGYSHLTDLLNLWFPKVSRRICIVDNSLEGDLEMSLTQDTDLISGDNVARDFSGYDKGVRWMNAISPACTNAVWIFANDTFHRDLGVPTGKYFTKDVVLSGIQKQAFVGYEDRYPEAVELFGLPLQRWIRTNFFALPDATLKKVLPLALGFSDGEIFGDTPRSFFREPSPLSKNYRTFLRTWLFGLQDPKGEFKSVWRSAEKLTSHNLREFQVKAKAILSEHYLSARIQSLGTKTFPVNNPLLSMFVSTNPAATIRRLPNQASSSEGANLLKHPNS